MNWVCQSFRVSPCFVRCLLTALVGGWLFGQLVNARMPKTHFPQGEKHTFPMREKNAANREIRSVVFRNSASTLMPGPRANSNEPNRAGQVHTLPVKRQFTPQPGPRKAVSVAVYQLDRRNTQIGGTAASGGAA